MTKLLELSPKDPQDGIPPGVRGTLVNPDGTPEGAASSLPRNAKCRPNSPWRYKANPMRWDWNELYGWHPSLGKFHMSNGLDGLKVTKKGYEDLDIAIQKNKARGWIIIDLGDARLGKFANYLQTFPVRRGGVRHVSVFVTPDVIGNEVEWTTDEVAYKEFLDILVSSGAVAPLRDVVKRMKIRKQGQIVARLENDLFHHPDHPMVKIRYERESRKLAGMGGEDVATAKAEAKEFARAVVQGRKVKAEKTLSEMGTPDGVQCPDCDRSFPTQASLDGHKPHCKGGSS